GADPGLRGVHARSAEGRRDVGRRVGRRRRRVVGDQLGRTEPGRGRRREGEAAPPRPAGGCPLRLRGSRRGPRARDRRLGFGGRGGAPPAGGAGGFGVFPPPARPLAATSTPTPNRRGSRYGRRWPATGTSPRGCGSRPPASTRSTTCLPPRSRRLIPGSPRRS